MAGNEKKPKAVTESVTSAVDANDFKQRIENKAYELYVNRGFKNGHDWNDWFEAQKAVEAQITSIDKDCIRSESFYKSTHQSNPLPSEIDAQKTISAPFV